MTEKTSSMNPATFFESLSMKKQSNEMTEDWYPADSLYSFLTSSQMSSFVPAEDGSAERGNVDFNTDSEVPQLKAQARY